MQLILAVDLMPTVQAPHAMVSAVEERATALGRVGLAVHLPVLAGSTLQKWRNQTTTSRSLASTANPQLASSIAVGMSQMRVSIQAQAPMATCAKTRLGTT